RAAAEAIAQRCRAFAHDGVLEQPRAQLIFTFTLVHLVEWEERREQAARLQQHETRREREESRDLIGRQRVERADAREIRVGEFAELHREDVELLLLDELEQKVERTVEPLDGDVWSLRPEPHGRASRSARARRRSSASRGRS